MTDRDTMESEGSGKLSSSFLSNTTGQLKIFPLAGNYRIEAEGSPELRISKEELSMVQEGTIPSKVAAVLAQAGIVEEELIRTARGVLDPLYNFEISSADNIWGLIRNGDDGLIQERRVIPGAEPEKQPKPIDICRFRGTIGPVLMIDGKVIGLRVTFDDDVQDLPLAEAYSHIRDYLSIPPGKMQQLKEVLGTWVHLQMDAGLYVDLRTSPIYIQDGIIKLDWQNTHDIADILTRLRDFHAKASHPLAYRTVLAWSLLAPLHYAFKDNTSRIIQTPQIFMVGKTKGGKTELANFYIGKGFSLPHEKFFFSYEQVGTRFTMMKHLGESNLPALLDDLAPDWILQNKGNLKSYVQTGHFGDRGRSDQTLTEYKGRRSFIATINSEIRRDDDLAASMRLIILHFTERNRAAKNLDAWNDLFNGVPEGFIYDLFQIIFEGQKLVDVLKEVEQFKTPAEWINYVLGKLNMLSQWYGIPEWPLYTEEDVTNEDSNALEIAQAFLAEWERIQRNSAADEYELRPQKYRSPIEGEFLVDFRGLRRFIWFTPGAFKTIVARLNLRLPYRTAADFLNNVQSSEYSVRVENEGQLKSKKIGNLPLKTYCISVPAGSDDNEWN